MATAVSRIAASLFILIVAFTILAILNAFITSLVERKKAKKERAQRVRKTISLATGVLAGILILFVWGINITNLWVIFTSVLTLIAIGFIAVWSLLSNILAGVLLFFNGTLRTGDTITILPEKITGKVIHAGVLFLELEDKQKNTFYVPNNLCFQKYIKKHPKPRQERP